MSDELVFADAGFGTSALPYLAGWDLQRAVHERRSSGQIPDSCLLLEHEPVYTAGKRTEILDRPVGDPGAPVIDVDRGGKITWHGPGQLTGYPIIALREPVDVVAYVRALEQALIDTCAEFGVAASRIDGRSGAWVTDRDTEDEITGGDGAGDAGPGCLVVPGGPNGGVRRPDRKLGAIGVRVARGVTMHGFALNCDCDLAWFDRIVPCGIRDAGVTSLSAEAGRPITVADAAAVIQRHLATALGFRSWRRVTGTAELTGESDRLAAVS